MLIYIIFVLVLSLVYTSAQLQHYLGDYDESGAAAMGVLTMLQGVALIGLIHKG